MRLAWMGAFTWALTSNARSPSCETTERLTLKNGIEVVLSVDPAAATVAVVSSVHAGSRHDPPGYEGLAHFVEHLTFRKAVSFASPLELYAEAGATGVNGTTSRDTTNYVAVVPASQLERALWIEARRLGAGLDLVDEESAILERNVVLREHLLRIEGPIETGLNAIVKALFPVGHPYQSVADSRGSIGRLALSDARNFFAQYYRPERVRLALVGNFDVAHAKQLIDRHWAGLKASNGGAPYTAAMECSWAKRTQLPSVPRLVVRSRLMNEHMEFYWPVGSGEDVERERGIFSVFARRLSEAAEELGVAHGLSAGLGELELSDYWRLSLDIFPGQALDNAEPLVRATLEELQGASLEAGILSAERQAFERSEHLASIRPLDRALQLVRRECVPSACVDAAQYLTPSAFVGLSRFDPGRALIVEWRHHRKAPDDGAVEELP